jgi:perosamine synthetase
MREKHLMVSNQRDISDKVIAAIQRVIGDEGASLHEPRFEGNEWVYLKECLDSTFVSSVGKFVDRFEADLVDYTGAKYAIAVVNGTAALHIALKLSGVTSGDEVLLPALTFVATANAVTYCNAVPHFVDSEYDSLGIDSTKLREYLVNHTERRAGQCVNKLTGRVIRAIVPMHTFGHPSDLDGLLALARDFNIVLVEDAAESLGSTYKSRHTGTFGRFGTLSFNGNKTITTGGGGALLTNDPELALHAKHVTTTAKIQHLWDFNHDEVGYNYRMPNINAALGCAQLEKLPDKLLGKRNLFSRYEKAFSCIDGISLISEPSGCQSNFWLQTLMLDEGFASQRDIILKATNKAGLMTRPAWILMSKLAPFRDCPRMNLDVAESLSQRLINIPSSDWLGLLDD